MQVDVGFADDPARHVALAISGFAPEAYLAADRKALLQILLCLPA